MAEQTTGIKNKKLLAVAIALGFLVVLIYNFHINRVRTAGKGKQVTLLRFVQDLTAGTKITPKNVKRVQVPAKSVEVFGSVVKLESPEQFDRYRDLKLAVDVEMNQYLRTDHLRVAQEVVPSTQIPKGMVAAPVAIDPALCPGEILRPGDLVNLIGDFELSDQSFKCFRIVKSVRVYVVGGRGAREGDSGSTAGSSRGLVSYKSIVVGLTQEVSLELAKFTRGRSIRVEVLNRDAEPPKDAEKISEDLIKLAKEGKLVGLSRGR
ncbi:MAG: CpaB family protein [Planctomycetota bacterium]|jgi:Flp pilus assembly protein CpaB